VSRTAISRFSPIASARRLFLLVALVAAAFAMASIGHVSGASAQPVQGEGITIDCSLGGGFVPPGTIIDLPAAGELPAIKVICGDDGKWHVSAAIVKRGSAQLALAPSAGVVLLKK
jgi:hypothetical protein